MGYLREALALFRKIGNRLGEAWTLLWLGRAGQADDVEAGSSMSLFSQALHRFRELNQPEGVGWSLFYIAMEAFNDGDIDSAAQRAGEAIEFGIQAGGLQLVRDSQRIAGMVAARRGDHAGAEQLLGEANAGVRWFH